MNLRNLSRQTLIHTERQWGLLLEMTDPDGTVYTESADYGEPLRTLQTLTDFKKVTPDGEEVTVINPVIAVRRDALERVPKAGENWFIRVQIEPIDADLSDLIFEEIITAYPDSFESYGLDGSKAPEGGQSIGFTRLYLVKVEQDLDIQAGV